jgi:AraC family transcriptional regulator, regulatory protein of adaptative response / methylated-DNA-[protein]-cysteine methyltransferase
MTDYERISKAIYYLAENFKEQPELEKIAEHIGLSPFHFQKLFKDWAGVSPKKFLQYISVEHARKLLSDDHSLAETSYQTGLSGTSRLHDLFITIEGMTPGEYKNGGQGLTISWEIYESPFGEMIIGSTAKGICSMSFSDNADAEISSLKNKFSSAHFQRTHHPHHSAALKVFSDDPNELSKIKLHLKGTPFQLRVWEALLKIPSGRLTTYAGLAEKTGNPKAARAVGSAVGDNPVAYLIPCHRVIRSSGIIGEYHWGSVRKTAIIGRESAKVYC